MKFRTFTLAALFAACAITTLSSVAAAQLEARSLAPADEYFGRIRLSIVGIRNSITTLSSESADTTLTPASLRARIAMLEEALADWGRRYPHDPGVARSRSDLASIMGHVSMVR